MKTIRITRQGFPNIGQHSWMNYLKFILSKKYNVIIDSENPDLILTTNLNYNANIIDTYTKQLPTNYNANNNKNGVELKVAILIQRWRPILITIIGESSAPNPIPTPATASTIPKDLKPASGLLGELK